MKIMLETSDSKLEKEVCEWKHHPRFDGFVRAGCRPSSLKLDDITIEFEYCPYCGKYITAELQEDILMDTENTIVPGAQLKKIRTAAGLTMPQLSELSGVGLDNLKSYETGRRDINIARVNIIKALAQALNCTIEDLLDK